MKVKTADLKNNLSHYLRLIRESGDGIEVCLREEPVAMLVPIRSGQKTGIEAQEWAELRRRFASVGLVLLGDEGRRGPLPPIEASVAGDTKSDVSTVAAMRAERDW